jgi:hypothetical protein
MKTHREVEIKLHVFLTSALDRCDYAASYSDNTRLRYPLLGYRIGLEATKTPEVHGLSPRANYIHRATASCQRS